MIDKNNNFLESLKVLDTNKTIPMGEEIYGNKELYTCLRLMGDTSKIQNFLLKMEKEANGDKKTFESVALRYFHSVNTELGDVEYDYIEKKINVAEFSKKISEVCKGNDVDFNYLMEITEKIDALQRGKELDYSEGMRLAKEIEAKAIEYREEKIKGENVR